jgi:hypothetical protein
MLVNLDGDATLGCNATSLIKNKDYFFDKKKVQLFFTLEFPDRKWNSRSGKKYFFFGEDGIFFDKLAFSAVICGIRLHLHLTSI